MKIKFDVERTQPDPFVFEDNGKFYMYVTASEGVEAYSSKDIFGVWHFEGVVAQNLAMLILGVKVKDK